MVAYRAEAALRVRAVLHAVGAAVGADVAEGAGGAVATGIGGGAALLVTGGARRGRVTETRINVSSFVVVVVCCYIGTYSIVAVANYSFVVLYCCY